jgi:transcriptional regulator with XRE-family HTH domain
MQVARTVGRMTGSGSIGYESGRDLVIETCDRMKLARMKAGIEQEEMAEILGVSSSTVSNWENGRVSVKLPFLSAWAQVTGFNMSSLIPPPPCGAKLAEAPHEH